MPALPRFTNRSVTNLQLPKLGNPPSFTHFFKNVYGIAANRKTLAVMDKAEIDAEYHKLSQQRFKHDDISIRRCMEEVSMSKPGGACVHTDRNGRYTRRQLRRDGSLFEMYMGRLFGNVTTVLESVKQLKLPPVGNSGKDNRGKGRANDHWDRQTYAVFAVKLERLNSDIQLDRHLVDEAFRYTVSIATGFGKETGTSNVTRKDIHRCITRVCP